MCTVKKLEGVARLILYARMYVMYVFVTCGDA
jgi:hypothetical protein